MQVATLASPSWSSQLTVPGTHWRLGVWPCREGLCQPAEPQPPGAGLAIVVAVHKGHLMTARGGVDEHLQAASPASREKTDVKEQLRKGEDMDK